MWTDIGQIQFNSISLYSKKKKNFLAAHFIVREIPFIHSFTLSHSFDSFVWLPYLSGRFLLFTPSNRWFKLKLNYTYRFYSSQFHMNIKQKFGSPVFICNKLFSAPLFIIFIIHHRSFASRGTTIRLNLLIIVIISFTKKIMYTNARPSEYN